MIFKPQKDFLHSKIMELQQALFFSLSQSVLKLPVSLINVLHVDEVGQVWFMINRPQQKLNEFDRDFLARLDLYKKGKDFHLQVTGKACIICDPEELNCAYQLSEEIRRKASTDMVLVKMKIDHIFYNPHKVKIPSASRLVTRPQFNPSTFVKTLQYIVKDIIPVFQSH